VGVSLGIFIWLMLDLSSSNLRACVEQWATKAGYKILTLERRWFFGGPFIIVARGQAVARLQIQAADGTVSTVWARCTMNPFGEDEDLEIRS
jgi:hypothetical protein